MPAGVVGDVDDLGDLGHRVEDRDLDALAQRDRGHAAALAPAAEAQVGDRVLDRDELGVAAVRAIAGLICSSSTWITRWRDLAGQRSGSVGGDARRRRAAGRFGFCITMPPPVRSSVAPASLSTLAVRDGDGQVVVVLDQHVVGPGLVDGAGSTCRR